MVRNAGWKLISLILFAVLQIQNSFLQGYLARSADLGLSRSLVVPDSIALPTIVPRIHQNRVHEKHLTSQTNVDPYVGPIRCRLARPARNTTDEGLDAMDWHHRPHKERQGRVIYFTTPTFQRPTQIPDLMKLQHTLMLAEAKWDVCIYWVVIEDAPHCSQRVRNILEASGLNFAHDAAQSPQKADNPFGHRGVNQRNRGLDIVQKNLFPDQIAASVQGLPNPSEGVVYFGDDDNNYHLELFRELQYTRRVGVMAVAFVGMAVERCRVNPQTGKVNKIFTRFKPKQRKFPIDMGGLAFALAALNPRSGKNGGKLPRFQTDWPKSMLETEFTQLVADSYDQLTPLGANCTEVMAFHLKTRPARVVPIQGDPESKFLAAELGSGAGVP